MSDLKQKLVEYKSQHPEATIREMQKLFNVSSPSVVHYHLNAEGMKEKVRKRAAELRERAAKVEALTAELARTKAMLEVAENTLQLAYMQATHIASLGFSAPSIKAKEMAEDIAKSRAQINKMKGE